MDLTDIIKFIEEDDPKIKPFLRDNLPRNMLALAVKYPSGRIEVYKVGSYFFRNGQLSLLGDLSVKKFKNRPQIERINYRTKTFQSSDFAICKFYYY